MVHAIGHNLILKITLAALIANGAVKRVVHQQKFQNPFPGLFHHRRVSEYFGWLAIGARAKIIDGKRARSLGFGWSALHFNKTHAAVASDGQAFMIAETWNFSASLFAGLQQRKAIFDLKFYTIYLKLGHLFVLTHTEVGACVQHPSLRPNQTQLRLHRSSQSFPAGPWLLKAWADGPRPHARTPYAVFPSR